ncbi:MAG: hypothetical protein R2784_12900 [Saprospiraceae bacterium]
MIICSPEVPALPAFALQKAVSTTIREYEQDYWDRDSLYQQKGLGA